MAAALREGRQTILLRAGGIADPGGRFGFPHATFWIYPTRFHESADRLVESARGLVDEAAREGAEATRRIDLVATLDLVQWVDDFAAVERLSHVLAPEVVRQRFDYRERGLAVAVVRVWRRREPHRIVETDSIAGCRSWVAFDEPLSCDGVEPVIPEAAFAVERRRVLDVIGTPGKA